MLTLHPRPTLLANGSHMKRVDSRFPRATSELQTPAASVNVRRSVCLLCGVVSHVTRPPLTTSHHHAHVERRSEAEAPERERQIDGVGLESRAECVYGRDMCRRCGNQPVNLSNTAGDHVIGFLSVSDRRRTRNKERKVSLSPSGGS